MNLSQSKKEKLMRIVMNEVDIAIQEGNSPFGAILIDKDGKETRNKRFITVLYRFKRLEL